MTQNKNKSLPVNIAGIALSLFLSFAVWGAVVLLIGNNESELLGKRTISEDISLFTSEAARTEPYITYSISANSSPYHMTGSLLKYLAEVEMTELLSAETKITKPAAEEKTEDFIGYLAECGYLKGGEYQYDMKLYGFAFTQAGDETEQHAFWKGTAQNSDYTVTYVINAESGEIWYAEIVSNSDTSEFDEIIPERLLVVYEAFLGYPMSRPVYYSEKSAYRIYGNSFATNTEVAANRLIMRLLPY